MFTPKALPILGLILLSAISLAAVKSHTVPGKYCGRPAPASVPGHAYHSSLDVIYTSTEVPVVIPDGPNGDTAVSHLNIPDAVTINDLNVMVTITHTWIRDLRIALVSPNDSELVLLDLLPMDDAVNLTETWFDDEAPVSIDSGVPPFTGRFRPQHPLSRFDGMNSQGTWTLRVLDRFALDTGSVQAWSIEINRALQLTGTVTNRTTHLPLPDVKIEALPAGNITTTNSNGVYGFDALTPDTYDFRFSKAQYDTVLVTGQIIYADSTVSLDTSLFSAVQIYDFASTSPRIAIPDTNTGIMTLTVDSSLVISNVSVTINITHTYDGDLDIYLVSPLSDSVQLWAFNGSVSGDNFTETLFDDSAAESINQGVPPFTGSYRPVQPLSRFDSTNTHGTWQLVANDVSPGDSGYIENFTLHIQVGTPTAVHEPGILPPSSFGLSNYPNPFNGTTLLRFSLPIAGRAELIVFDLLGRRVATLVNGYVPVGEHSVNFDAGYLPSGLYIAQLSASGRSKSQKILLLR